MRRSPLGAFGARGVGPARPGAAVVGVTRAFLGSRALVQPWLPWASVFADPGAQGLPVRSPPMKSRTLEQAPTWRVSP